LIRTATVCQEKLLIGKLCINQSSVINRVVLSRLLRGVSNRLITRLLISFIWLHLRIEELNFSNCRMVLGFWWAT
jgi:hypothetical protein